MLSSIDLKAAPSIHKALASLDRLDVYRVPDERTFDPQGSREPRLYRSIKRTFPRLSFDPQGSREPRQYTGRLHSHYHAFDPQGSREPRRSNVISCPVSYTLRSTRLSRASTAKMHNYSCIYATFTCFILYIFYKSFIKLKFPRVI